MIVLSFVSRIFDETTCYEHDSSGINEIGGKRHGTGIEDDLQVYSRKPNREGNSAVPKETIYTVLPEMPKETHAENPSIAVRK